MKHFLNLLITESYVLFLSHKTKAIMQCHANKYKRDIKIMQHSANRILLRENT